jgi:hypothetical protein
MLKKKSDQEQCFEKFYERMYSMFIYSEIFLINNCQCQNEVENHTVPP